MVLVSKSRKLSIMRLLNSYPLKELLMRLKYLKFEPSQHKVPMLIACIDGRRNSQGLADRFKGIVSIYALSKALKVPFRCIYTHPFHLSDFLVPNSYKWLPQEGELSSSIHDVRFRILRKQKTMERLGNLLPLNKQVRVYANLDYLEEINQQYEQNFSWGQLFNELFMLTPELEVQLNNYQERIGGKYIACVFRFQALLGDFKEYSYRPLSEKKQAELIAKNKSALNHLVERENMPVLVTSDSQRFISEVKDLRNIHTLPGTVVHLDCTHDARREVYMKSFIDFFMISRAEKVFSIGSSMMYPTKFPVYAAKLGNVPFERISIL